MSSATPSATGQPVTLHVGTPKSGTTFLQRALGRHRDLLREHGYLYPGDRPSHFIEAMSLRERGFRGHTADAVDGAWDRLVEEVMAHDGPTLISHEMIGGSDRTTIERAVTSFPGRRVRVVVTCRDLGRQLPAVWQEGVKNGDTDRYQEFLERAVSTWRDGSTRQGVWAGQNLAALGSRWGQAVGMDQVVLVTVPPPGAGTDDLWLRFAEAVDLPDADFSLRAKPGNPSLGTVETELLRRFTEHLPDDLPWPEHARAVKRRFAQQRLVREQRGGALTVPEDYRPETERIAGEMVAALRSAGHPVVGDLSDLTPAFREGGTLPDAVGEAELLDVALELLVPLVLADAPPARGGQDRPRDRSGDRAPGAGEAAAEAGDARASVLARIRARLRR